MDLPEPDSVEQGTTGFEPEDPEADEDYTFDGWFYDPEGTEPFDPEKPIKEDLTLYGKWTPKTVTVTYEWADPENVPSDAELPADQPVRKGQPYTAERMETKENWVFKGWFTDPECTVPFADGMELNGGHHPVREVGENGLCHHGCGPDGLHRRGFHRRGQLPGHGSGSV